MLMQIFVIFLKGQNLPQKLPIIGIIDFWAGPDWLEWLQSKMIEMTIQLWKC